MAGLRAYHFPAEENTAKVSSPCRTRALWSEHLSSAEKPTSPAETPLPPPQVRYERCFLCPICNHNFLKWADQVRPDELVDVPNCGGCSAGVCRARRERSGPNAGRTLFMCRIKEGEGSCGYRVWQDELEKSTPGRDEERINLPQSPTINGVYTTHANNELVKENEQINERSKSNNESPVIESSGRAQRTSAERVTSFQSLSPTANSSHTKPVNTDFVEENNKSNGGANNKSSRRAHILSDVRMTLFPTLMVNSDHTEPANVDLVEESKEGNEGADNESHLIDTSNLECVGVTFRKMDLSNELSSRRPHKRSRHGDLKGDESTLSALGVSSQDKILVNSGDLTTLTKILIGSKTYNKPLLNPCHNPQLSSIEPNDPSTETNIQHVMSKSISKAFGQAAMHLQNDFLALLDKMDVTEHEAMTRAAQATFAALDRLLFDHRDFKGHAEEYIHCATSLAEIERSMPGDESQRKLIEHCSSERRKLDEINSVHAKAVDSVNNNRKRLKLLQEEVSSTMDWLFQIEAELSCCEVEMRSMEGELENISRNKEDLEEKYVTAANELERLKELIERKEAERDAVKAAFERAKESLRG
ncbi:hypothetical protein PHJA_001949700 [Phtheirospermum japonicum]|uniref:GRF-type domain-containing protein n=1 Tax=Phtheirospermum japonicum TaxID=374723 RepID=A0A830CFQ1_9LAMI|nr:hypothetical protein PHJA_001949700 [Phtheirospermum japonicum]